MKIIEGKILADFTTFRIGGKARYFCTIKKKEDIKIAFDFAREKKLPIFILGGGSNILVSDKGFDGLVIKIEIMGIKEIESSANQESRRHGHFSAEKFLPLAPVALTRPPQPLDLLRSTDSTDIFIRAGAGEDWDGFVDWTVKNGYGGLENLSFIPGTVGAAPVQNIGAYGTEVGDYIDSVEVFDTLDGSFKNLSKKECDFSYRNSLFKREKSRYIIVSVLFKLKKDAELDISYKDLKEYFEKGLGTRELGIRKLENASDSGVTTSNPYVLTPNPSVAEVREAIISIRKAKLPDVRYVGTAGSFFKNPIISKERHSELKERYPELPGFIEADGRIKIPLAWIIDKVCGLKGKKFGKAGIHDTQALVIVNHGDASFEDVEKVASEVQRLVKEKTGIEIEREVIMV